MRDLLWYDPSTPVEQPDFDPDPISRTRAAMRKDLPKRFWKEVAIEPVAGGGSRVLLDGRPVKTPGKRELVLPRADLAEAIAAEWRAQDTHVDPGTMPLTRLANSVIDGVTQRFDEVADDAAKYAATDLVCYRADAPERLVERQTAGWDPLLDWVEDTYGARLLVAEGIVHVGQDGEALATLRGVLTTWDSWRLAGFHTATTLTGSFVVALALAEGRLDRDTAWALAHLDENWNAELWGRDPEAEMRLGFRRIEFDAAAAFMGV
ncbi:ATP12 family chaperone protein [Pinisolibacter sp.]|uniref:ATP12 family chaperone protein n=1 Tax=Pinisolibacter sp. TaxID=2172024 RepID=UPI002FDEF48F